MTLVIFSGMISTRQCAACDICVARSSPTSLLFLMALAGSGTALVVPMLMGQLGKHWWVFAAAIVGSLILAVGVVIGTDSVVMKLQGELPHDCAKCGQEMTQGGGFYDFVWIPTASEVVSVPVYFGVVLLGKWVTKLVGF